MPYIKAVERPQINEAIKNLKQYVNTKGQLNYAITCLCIEFLKSKSINYDNISDIVTSLECAKLEFYRRKASIYEDEKIKINGDVF